VRRLVLLFALLLGNGVAQADNMLMARLPLKAEIVLAYVEDSIREHGYRIAHLQTCDMGLADFGYESDFYRVVFFGKVDEVRMVSERYPELVSYLPLKIAVIAEQGETLLAVLDPEALTPYYDDERVRIQLGRWHNDLASIFDEVRREIDQRLAPAAN
jgi:uncharacterized protein (DUF302 family)